MRKQYPPSELIRSGLRVVATVAVLGALLAALGILLAQSAAALVHTPTSLTVTSTLDSDGTTCTSICTLRQAINVSNLSDPGPGNRNTIRFNLLGTGAQTITTSGAVMIISKPVLIDGTSQPGFDTTTRLPVVE